MKPLTYMISLESLKWINSRNQRIDDVTDTDKCDGPAKIPKFPWKSMGSMKVDNSKEGNGICGAKDKLED